MDADHPTEPKLTPRTVLRRLTVWALCGAVTGFLMALLEYVYLASTVEQLADSGETMVLGTGLLGAFPLLGAVLGLVLFGVGSPLGLVLGRIGFWRRLAVRRVVRWVVFGGAVVGFFAGFFVNASAYHRLYVEYHVALSCLTFLTGFVGAHVARFLLPELPEKERRKATWAGIAGGVGVLACAIFSTPQLVTNENLRSIVSDRGIVSGHILLWLRTLADRDGDGFAAPPLGYDCDDGDPKRYPMRYDVPGNGVDEDCTGADRKPRQPLPAPPSRIVGPKRILVLTIDAVRADRWPTRYKRNLMPNLLKLSKRGAFFGRAYATSNWTVPSIYALHTGRYPSHFRFVKAALGHDDKVTLVDPRSAFARNPKNVRKLIPVPALDKSPTLAQELKTRGYVTATVLDIPFLKPEMGMAKGFDIVDQTPYKKANFSLTGVTSPLMARQAMRIIREHAKDRLFLYMHWDDPHAPYRSHRGSGDLGTSDVDLYDGEIRFVDHWMGAMFDALQREGLLDDTLIVVSADHGEEFGEHGGRYHASTVYEEQVAVPLLMVGPGIRPAVYGWVVSHVDLLSTILAMVDGTPGRNLGAGMDLTPLLTRGVVSRKLQKRAIYSESRRFQNFKQALINLRFKLIRDNKAGTTVLFDLQNDPQEHRNVIRKRRKLARYWLGYMMLILDKGG